MVLLRCPRCAKEVPDDSQFCRRCGCALATREAWSEPRPARVVPTLPNFGGARQPKPDRPRDDFRLARTKSRPGIGLLALIGIGAGVGAFNTALRVKSPAPLQSPPVIVRDPRSDPGWPGRTAAPWSTPPSYATPMHRDAASGGQWPPTPYVPGPPPLIRTAPGHAPLPPQIAPQVLRAWPNGPDPSKPNDGRR